VKEGRLITGDQREFVTAPWDGVNRSGYQPLDDKVMVRMDEHASITSGGIHIPDTAAERQSIAGETGVVVALGPAAFVWDDDARRMWSGQRPEPGDRVYIERYAGQVLQGIDGMTYRLVSQRCVGAVALPPE
jgi:chaperonin GroES